MTDADQQATGNHIHIDFDYGIKKIRHDDGTEEFIKPSLSVTKLGANGQPDSRTEVRCLNLMKVSE